VKNILYKKILPNLYYYCQLKAEYDAIDMPYTSNILTATWEACKYQYPLQWVSIHTEHAVDRTEHS